MASSKFGLELLKHSVENDIKNNNDRVVVLIHWVLLDSKFKCLGCGDSKKLAANETTSELLPSDWNEASPNSYNLRYMKDTQLYLAKIVNCDGDMLFYLISGTDLKVESVIISSQEVESFDEDKIIKKISAETVGSSSFQKKVNTAIVQNFNPNQERSSYLNPPPLPPGRCGRCDLDPPFLHGGPLGGMIFQVPEMRRRLGGAHPCFDPINPIIPGPGGAAEPDANEFLPPGLNNFL